jgi:DNA-binding NarL/FixJ family response regulator
MNTIRVLVVDDHPIFRDAVAGLLAMVPGMEVTAVAACADQATAAVAANPPDVVLMDIHLPGTNGVEATRSVLELAPSTAVLALTMVDDDDMVLAAMAAGARGYLLKDATADEVVAAVRLVAAGGAVLGARIASRLLGPGATEAHRGGSSTTGAIVAAGEELTARERDVLEHLAKGANNRQIARELGVSLKTVQNHVSRILDKLQAADRTQAVLRARGIDPRS